MVLDDPEKGGAAKKPIIVTDEPLKRRRKLGWFQGVFLRVVSNLVGVMLYLRIAWVAGQAGIRKSPGLAPTDPGGLERLVNAWLVRED